MCVSGRSGVTVGAEKAFQLARKNGKATMVFVSKCDLENANYFKILEDMKIKFGSTVCPCVVPAKLDDGTPMYINLFSQKPSSMRAASRCRSICRHRPPFPGPYRAMSEAIAETDDELMEKFFGGEAFTTEEIVDGMRKGVKDGLITLCSAAALSTSRLWICCCTICISCCPARSTTAFWLRMQRRTRRADLCRERAYRCLRLQDCGRPLRGQAELSARRQRQDHRRRFSRHARTGETEKMGKPLTVMGKKQTAVPPSARKALAAWARTSALPACAENSAWRSSPSAQASACQLRAIEQGSPSVAIGSYATVLLAIGMKDELSHVAANDELGRYLQDQDLEPKKRAPRSARFTFGRGAESE